MYAASHVNFPGLPPSLSSLGLPENCESAKPFLKMLPSQMTASKSTHLDAMYFAHAGFLFSFDLYFSSDNVVSPLQTVNAICRKPRVGVVFVIFFHDLETTLPFALGSLNWSLQITR